MFDLESWLRWHSNYVFKWLGWRIYGIRRWLEGARIVEDGDTVGSIREEGIDIAWGGMCPVQGEGIVDGWAVYYRSRGEGWQFHVAASETEIFDNDVYFYEKHNYFWPQGGYVASSVSERCIREAITAFRQNSWISHYRRKQSS